MFEPLEARVLLSHSWYVSPRGNDLNAGTLALPFKTIQHAANLAQPGDTVFIRAGTYRETVTPPSGTSKAPITFAAYNNETVIVSGADLLSGWSDYSGSIYQASQPWDLGEGNNEVFVDGQMMNEARWPNTGTDLLHPTLAKVNSVYNTVPPNGDLVSATAVLGTSGLPGKPGDWVGATVMIGTGQDWVMQSATVVSSAANSLTIAYQHYNRYQTPAVGNTFYLSNSFKALDASKEWYRDPNTGKLYLWDSSGDNPANHTVEVKRRTYAFELRGRSYVNLSGIHIFAASIDTGPATNHVNLNAIYATYVSQRAYDPIAWDRRDDEGTSGLILNGSYNVLTNSTIGYSSSQGVWMAGSHNTISNTTIHDVDYAVGAEAAITINGSGQLVANNTIYNTGRDGIVIAESANAARINNNRIHDIGLLATDLGAIYTHGTDGGGTEIAYNTIYNVRTGGFGGVGVYLDNGSSGFIVHNNTISNTNNAIKVNPPAYNNDVYSNSISFGSQVRLPNFKPSTLSGSGATLQIRGTLGGYRSEADAINDYGVIVGTSNMPGGGVPAFLDNGTMTKLPTLGGDYATASAINNSGQIVGSSIDAAGTRHAFLYSGGRTISLGALPGDTVSSASGINASGQIVGVSVSQQGLGRAFVYANGKMSALGTLGGSTSQADAINDGGAIVGSSTVAGDRNSHAFVYSAGKMKDLGTLGGDSSYAHGINSSSVVVGESLVRGDGAFHAFMDANGTMTDLGVLSGFTNSVATAINNRGDIVGYCYNSSSSSSTTHAFLYRDGQMIDLTKLLPANSGWVLSSAAGINNNDQIAGYASDPNANQRAFVLSVVG